jgi:hypothetical protein
MDQNEIILEILKVIIEGENKRNKLFEKTLHIFLSTVVSVTIILCITICVIINTLFVG